MFYDFCSSGNWGSLGGFGVGSWIGLILTLIFWVGLVVALTIFVVGAIKLGRVPGVTGLFAGGQPTAVRKSFAQKNLQAQYARGEITREQYELRKQELG